MKNFFLVINKEKLYAYVVSVLTICILFLMSGIINKDLDGIETTSSNLTENAIENNVVKMEKNQITTVN